MPGGPSLTLEVAGAPCRDSDQWAGLNKRRIHLESLDTIHLDHEHWSQSSSLATLKAVPRHLPEKDLQELSRYLQTTALPISSHAQAFPAAVWHQFSGDLR